MTTRRELLFLLRTRPGSTVADLADELDMTAVGVRRHLDALVAEGLVQRSPSPRRSSNGAGRPAVRWQLTTDGLEQFPRRYDGFALDMLADMAEEVGPEVVTAVFTRRAEKLAAQYEAVLDGVSDPVERVRRVAAMRDESDYLTETWTDDAGDVLLVENNCAVHRIAAEHSIVCAMELVVFRRVLGPDVSVSRVKHTMSGDPVCCYRICPRPAEEPADR